ncbi:MAG: DUF4260 family protein [Alphaproteobacteria bacterium]|nr:DUF4260 family protein [Alphaproteobacteria bacterium]MBV9693462.1 DUF4260 family protein [Alphaproteobacteria bacterium]
MEHTLNPGRGVNRLLRLEGLALFAAAVTLYAMRQGTLVLFLELFLLPDLAIALYVFGPWIGAAGYNATHSTVLPIVLAAVAVAMAQEPALWLALIWLAHIGFDRALGFGLKHATGFRDTHLSRPR